MLLGCESSSNIELENGIDITKVEKLITKNKSKESTIRQYLGTPTYECTNLKDGKRMVGFTIFSDHFYKSTGKGLFWGYITFGIKSKVYPFTLKFLTFKVNDKGIIENYKSSGEVFNYHVRLGTWVEYQRSMTRKELRSQINYTESEIEDTFAYLYYKKYKVHLDDLDSDKKDKIIINENFVSFQDEAYKHGQKAFGKCSAMITSPTRKNDGIKANEIFKM